MSILLACAVQAGSGCSGEGCSGGSGKAVEIAKIAFSKDAVGPVVGEKNDWNIQDFTYEFRTHSLQRANCKNSGKAVVGTPVKAVIDVCGTCHGVWSGVKEWIDNDLPLY